MRAAPPDSALLRDGRREAPRAAVKALDGARALPDWRAGDSPASVALRQTLRVLDGLVDPHALARVMPELHALGEQRQLLLTGAALFLAPPAVYLALVALRRRNARAQHHLDALGLRAFCDRGLGQSPRRVSLAELRRHLDSRAER